MRRKPHRDVHDNSEEKLLLAKTKTLTQPQLLFIDKSYDAEWVHKFCRED